MPSLSKPHRFLALPFLALACFAVAALAAGGNATVELGPVLTLVEEAAGHLAIGKGLDGDVLVAWSTPYGGVSEVRGLRLAASGGPLGPPFVIHHATDSLPQVSPDPGWNMRVVPGVGRGFLVMWDDANPTGGLFARRVRGRENEIVEGFEIHSSSARPSAVALAEGRFLLVHQRYDGRIAGQRFDPDGRPEGGELEIFPVGGLNPSAVGDAQGNLVVAWFARDPGNPRDGRTFLWARRFTPGGSPLGERRRLDSLSTDQIGWLSGATGSGGISAFSWERNGRVRLQFLGPDGSLRGQAIEAVQEPGHVWHDVAVDAAGRALVVWVDCCASVARARARLFTPKGRPLGPVFEVSTPVRGDDTGLGLRRQPAVAARDRGEFFVSWIGEESAEDAHPGSPAIFGIRVKVNDP